MDCQGMHNGWMRCNLGFRWEASSPSTSRPPISLITMPRRWVWSSRMLPWRTTYPWLRGIVSLSIQIILPGIPVLRECMTKYIGRCTFSEVKWRFSSFVWEWNEESKSTFSLLILPTMNRGVRPQDFDALSSSCVWISGIEDARSMLSWALSILLWKLHGWDSGDNRKQFDERSRCSGAEWIISQRSRSRSRNQVSSDSTMGRSGWRTKVGRWSLTNLHLFFISTFGFNKHGFLHDHQGFDYIFNLENLSLKQWNIQSWFLRWHWQEIAILVYTRESSSDFFRLDNSLFFKLISEDLLSVPVDNSNDSLLKVFSKLIKMFHFLFTQPKDGLNKWRDWADQL